MSLEQEIEYCRRAGRLYHLRAYHSRKDAEQGKPPELQYKTGIWENASRDLGFWAGFYGYCVVENLVTGERHECEPGRPGKPQP